MTTVDSSSAAESTMDSASNHHLCHPSAIATATATKPKESEAEEGDAEVWKKLNRSFKQVQAVLDRNRVLIQQVNENHQSRIPDNMVKNVALIQEINSNISKVVSLYSDLSSNFSSVFHQRAKNVDDKEEGEKP